MLTSSVLIGLLLAYLPLTILIHRFWHKHVERRAQRRLPTQGVALKSVMVALFIVLMLLGAAWLTGGVSLAWSAWAALVLAGIGYCYWLLICITESGRRYMIADLIARKPGITSEEIVSRYNRHQIIANRLERLEHWKTVTRQGQHYRPRLTLMLIASYLVAFWARVLGFKWPASFAGSRPAPRR